jgi:hypothetical protein
MLLCLHPYGILKIVLQLIDACYFLHNIMLEHNDVVDDDLLFVGHHDESRCQQIFRQVVSSEDEEM